MITIPNDEERARKTWETLEGMEGVVDDAMRLWAQTLGRYDDRQTDKAESLVRRAQESLALWHKMYDKN